MRQSAIHRALRDAGFEVARRFGTGLERFPYFRRLPIRWFTEFAGGLPATGVFPVSFYVVRSLPAKRTPGPRSA